MMLRPVALALLALAVQEKPKVEQTGTPRRFLAADYQKKILAIVGKDGAIEWQHPIRDIHDAWVLENGNVLFQESWTRIVELTPDKKVAWSYDAAKLNGNEGKKVEVHAFQRLAGGVTMIAESGPARIIEVDRDGKLLKEVKLKVEKPHPHRDTRNARKLAGGGYLVCHEGDAKVREYDGEGAVAWEFDVKSAVYAAVRLKNGNTLISCGNGNRVIEVDKSGKEVWAVGKTDLPGITLGWMTQVERLPNGNTVMVNCHAGPDNPQLIEVTPEKKVVWSYRDFANFGNALPVAQTLDDPARTIR
jgi:hypothetical protein